MSHLGFLRKIRSTLIVLFISFFSILVQGCYEEPQVTATVIATVPSTSAATFSQDRYYYHPVYSTPAQCNWAIQHGLNCDQWVTFYRNGVVDIVVSDIIHQGYYTVRGSIAYITLPYNSELPTNLAFEISYDGTYITDNYYNVTWYID